VEKLLPKGSIAASRNFGLYTKEIGFGLRDVVYTESKIRETLRLAQSAQQQLSGSSAPSPSASVETVELVAADRVKLLADLCRKLTRNLQDEDKPLAYSGNTNEELKDCSQLMSTLVSVTKSVRQRFFY